MIEEAQLTRIVSEIMKNLACSPAIDLKGRPMIPVGISNRHAHLNQRDLDLLFGPGYELTRLKDLQPGQFAAQETVTLVGPKGVIEKVRILGPVRRASQVEISRADGYRLGVSPPTRDSGDHQDTPGIVVAGPRGAVTLERGVIVARRHIHMSPYDADLFQLKDGDRVDVVVSGLRGVLFKYVLVRVHKDYELEMHIDLDEGNAADLSNRDMVQILGLSGGNE